MVSIEELMDGRPAQLDLNAVFGRPIDVATPQNQDRKQRRVIYWRKPDREGATDAGWITTGPEIMTNAPGYQSLMNKGFRPLEKFGNQISGQKYDSYIEWSATPGQRQRPETWLEVFFRAGGLTYVIGPNDPYGRVGDWLIPASQLISMGLHLNAEVRRVRPDLNSAQVLNCPHRCINENGSLRIFSGTTKEVAQQSLDQHMATKHALSEGTRAVGDVVEKLLQERKETSIDPTTIAAITAAVAAALGHAKPEEPKPQGPRYPGDTSHLDPEAAALVEPVFPDETWKRQELMAYAKERNLGHPRDNYQDAMKANTAEWLQHVINMIHTSPDPETPLNTEEVFS